MGASARCCVEWDSVVCLLVPDRFRGLGGGCAVHCLLTCAGSAGYTVP